MSGGVFFNVQFFFGLWRKEAAMWRGSVARIETTTTTKWVASIEPPALPAAFE